MNKDQIDAYEKAAQLQQRSVGHIKRQLLLDNPDFLKLEELVPTLRSIGVTPLIKIEIEKADKLQRELDVVKLLKMYYVEKQNYELAAEYRDFEKNIERELNRRLDVVDDFARRLNS